MLLETRGGLQREKHELETTGSSHARGKPASAWKATLSYGEEPFFIAFVTHGLSVTKCGNTMITNILHELEDLYGHDERISITSRAYTIQTNATKNIIAYFTYYSVG